MARSEQCNNFNPSALHIFDNKACYTGQRARKIPHELLKIIGIVNCYSLDLSYNELTSISGLSYTTYLKELILDNNELHDLKTLPDMPALTTLSLNNNKLMNIDAALEIIKKLCPIIEYVSFFGNPGYPDQLTDPSNNDDADYERYRLYAIYVLPNSLRFLDSRPVTRSEQLDANSRGHFQRIIKAPSHFPTASVTLNRFSKMTENFDYSPLPRTNRSPFDHRGAYGKCHHRYSGKNSEGNRFILNNDL